MGTSQMNENGIKGPNERVRFYSPNGSDQESLTQQSQVASVDINNIIERFDRTGQLPQNRTPAMYGDVSEISHLDFGELQEKQEETLERLQDLENELERRAVERSAREESLDIIQETLENNDNEEASPSS